MSDHHRCVGGHGLVHEIAIWHQVEVPQIVNRGCHPGGDVRVAGCRAVAGVVLERCEHAGPFPAAHVCRCVVGHHVGIAVEEPRWSKWHLADVRLDVDDGAEDHVDPGVANDRAVLGDEVGRRVRGEFLTHPALRGQLAEAAQPLDIAPFLVGRHDQAVATCRLQV